jgi:hypothetical protein
MERTFFVAPSRDKSHQSIAAAIESTHGWRKISAVEKKKVSGGSSMKHELIRRQPSTQEETDTANLARASTTAVAGSGFYIGNKQSPSSGITTPPPSWIWTLSEKDVDWFSVSSKQTVNHFQCASQLTTKAGLSATMHELHWYVNVDHRRFYPRSYQLSDTGDRRAFVVDFRRTCAATIIRTHLTLSTLPCAPKLLDLALKAASTWSDDLKQRFQLDELDKTMVNYDSIPVNSEFFDSDCITTVEWNEMLDYCEYLLSVSDEIEIAFRKSKASPTSNQKEDQRNLDDLLHTSTVKAAIAKFESTLKRRSKRILNKYVKPAGYRPCSIPTLAEIPLMIQKPETTDETHARLLWSDISNCFQQVNDSSSNNNKDGMFEKGRKNTVINIINAEINNNISLDKEELIVGVDEEREAVVEEEEEVSSSQEIDESKPPESHVKKTSATTTTTTTTTTFHSSKTAPYVGLKSRCERVMTDLSLLWPQSGIDNFNLIGSLPRNTWIVKAPGTSRGAGIELSRSLSVIIGRSQEMGGRVVQK